MPHPRKVWVVATGARVLAAHEAATLEALSRRIAALLGCGFGGSCTIDTAPSIGLVPHYYIPDDTLDAAQASTLGIRGPDDLFGGVVPHRFAATKVVSHALVDAAECMPAGWPHALGANLAGVVLPGYSVFSRADAGRACEALLGLGVARLKLARGIGGADQARVVDCRGLDTLLAALPADELAMHGAVLEQDLADATTYSIGSVRCAGIDIAYVGTQHTTRDRAGREVYGGSRLDVVRGGLDALGDKVRNGATGNAIRQAQAYDAAMSAAFPGLFASRRNYDVVAGRDRHGRDASGVLEQSWRIGGASPAEVAALEAFAADPSLRTLRTACHERHGIHAPPPAASVCFDGDDRELGTLCKYAIVESRNGYPAR
jgi:hypothetical protein